MTPKTEDLLQEITALPPIERAQLVERILATFSFPERRAIDGRWAAEAESRIEAFERGEIAASPVGEVFARIQSGAD